MPHTKSAKKNLRQSLERRTRNRKFKSMLKKEMKEVHAAAGSGDAAAAAKEASVAQAKLDRAAARGVIHPKKAARLKSRMSKMLKTAKAAKK